MAETLVVSYTLSKPPSTDLVEEVLTRCNDGVPDDHPYRDEFVLSDAAIGDQAEAILDGSLESFQYGAPDTERFQAFDYRVGVNRTDWTDCPSLELLVNDAYFRTDSNDTSEADARRASATLRTFVEGLYELLAGPGQVRYVCAVDDGDAAEYRNQQPLVTDADLTSATLPPVVWFQILPPELVDAVGRTELQEAPAWRVAALGDGALSLTVDELPKLPHAGLETNRDTVGTFLQNTHRNDS